MTYRSPKALEDCHNAANAYADTLRQQGMAEAAAVAGATHFMDGWWAARDAAVANIIRDLDAVRAEPAADPEECDTTPGCKAEVHRVFCASPSRDLTASEVRHLSTCRHCAHAIRSADAVNWVHHTGKNAGLRRCNPLESGLPYGFNACHPHQPCPADCLGSMQPVEP